MWHCHCRKSDFCLENVLEAFVTLPQCGNVGQIFLWDIFKYFLLTRLFGFSSGTAVFYISGAMVLLAKHFRLVLHPFLHLVRVDRQGQCLLDPLWSCHAGWWSMCWESQGKHDRHACHRASLCLLPGHLSISGIPRCPFSTLVKADGQLVTSTPAAAASSRPASAFHTLPKPPAPTGSCPRLPVLPPHQQTPASNFPICLRQFFYSWFAWHFRFLFVLRYSGLDSGLSLLEPCPQPFCFR